MAGFDDKKRRKGRLIQELPDEADVGTSIQIDLIGVDLDTLPSVNVGDVLVVDILRGDQFHSAVCRTGDGQNLGSLAAFQGIARLIERLDAGEIFNAVVVDVGIGRCQVEIQIGAPDD